MASQVIVLHCCNCLCDFLLDCQLRHGLYMGQKPKSSFWISALNAHVQAPLSFPTLWCFQPKFLVYSRKRQNSNCQVVLTQNKSRNSWLSASMIPKPWNTFYDSNTACMEGFWWSWRMKTWCFIGKYPCSQLSLSYTPQLLVSHA